MARISETAGWKQRREQILKTRDKCESCGLTQKESLLKHGRGLSIHHAHPYFHYHGLGLWMSVAQVVYREYKKRDALNLSFSAFLDSYKPEIDAEFECAKREYSFDRYMEMRDDDIRVLCHKCHCGRR